MINNVCMITNVFMINIVSSQHVSLSDSCRGLQWLTNTQQTHNKLIKF